MKRCLGIICLLAWLATGAACAYAAQDRVCTDVYSESDGWRRLAAPPPDAEAIRNSSRMPATLPAQAGQPSEDWFAHSSPKRIALCRTRSACVPAPCPVEILEYVWGARGWTVGDPSPSLQRAMSKHLAPPQPGGKTQASPTE